MTGAYETVEWRGLRRLHHHSAPPPLFCFACSATNPEVLGREPSRASRAPPRRGGAGRYEAEEAAADLVPAARLHRLQRRDGRRLVRVDSGENRRTPPHRVFD